MAVSSRQKIKALKQVIHGAKQCIQADNEFAKGILALMQAKPEVKTAFEEAHPGADYDLAELIERQQNGVAKIEELEALKL